MLLCTYLVRPFLGFQHMDTVIHPSLYYWTLRSVHLLIPQTITCITMCALHLSGTGKTLRSYMTFETQGKELPCRNAKQMNWVFIRRAHKYTKKGGITWGLCMAGEHATPEQQPSSKSSEDSCFYLTLN